MLQFGGGFFDEAGNVILDNEANQKAFDFYVGLVHEHGIAIPAPGGDQYNPSFWGAYSAGDVATIWGADWMNSVIKGFAPDLSGKWRAQPLPTSADAAIPTASVGGTAMVLTEQSQVPDAAFDFMVYTMLQREPTSNAALPGNREFWEHPVVIAPDEYFGGQEIGRLFIEQAELLLEPGAPFLIPNPNNPTAYDIFTRTALGPAVNGEKTAAQALADAAAELRATIEG
jgi:ABC-type glycerol-3-phosphate transport system substrate-binding protein